MLKLNYDDHVREHFKSLEILTVYDQYIFDCIVYLKNNWHKINLRCETHNYNTRNKNEIDIQKHRLSFFNKKPSYMGAKFLRMLPIHIKHEINQDKFKTTLKTFLLKSPHYSINEFLCINV